MISKLISLYVGIVLIGVAVLFINAQGQPNCNYTTARVDYIVPARPLVCKVALPAVENYDKIAGWLMEPANGNTRPVVDKVVPTKGSN